MNPGDYQKVKEIFQSVLEIGPEGRGTFLDEKCGGDEVIRCEVERLLNSYKSDYLEQPAAANVAVEFAGDGLRSGEKIGHYTIVSKIGAGGMGEVYLAEDGKLGRRVAIKILPEVFTADADRLHRFQQEARTASALNHPNILTIFEIGETDKSRYIATEYIDGETLRSKLNRVRLTVTEALEIAVQTASALAAAHESGIIHRDIKPENIMLRRDGLAKVLDFGLAKLSGPPIGNAVSQVSNDEPTVRIVKTEPGVIMGTVQYMSPEQTRGHATDARTDIWSLGCVLYEMLAGSPPFNGDTSADLIADIVKTRPAPLTRHNPEIPERLGEIAAKALEKNPDERYQTAKDLFIDLKRLKRKFEAEDILERPDPYVSTGLTAQTTNGPNLISTRKGQKDLTTVSSAEYLIWGIKAHRFTAAGITLLVLSLLGVTAYLVRNYWRSPNEARLAYASKIKLAAQALEASNLTSAKQFLDATRPGAGEEDLRGFEWGYLSRLHAERMASQPLSLPHNAWVEGVVFSPNGTLLATAGGDSIVRLWDVTTGQQIKEFVGHTALIWTVVFSPNGKTLLSGSEDRFMKLWDIETGRELFTVGGLQEPVSTPVFSPDGKTIATANKGNIKLWDPVSGKEKPGGFKTAGGDMLFGFSPNGKYLSIRGPGLSVIIWEMTAARGIATLSGHSGFLTDAKFSPDSRTVLTGSTDGTAKLWDLKTGRDLRTFKGHTDGVYDVAFSQNGKMIATGSHDKTIRFWDADKGNEITALKGHLNSVSALAISPDGRKVASGSPDNSAKIWNVPKDEARGTLREHTAAIRSLSFSPDGKLLASASGDKTAKIWDVETEQDRLTLTGHTDAVNSTAFLPGGQTLATGSNDRMVKLWDTVTGKLSLSFDSQASGTVAVFSPDGKSIATSHFFNGPTVRLWDAATGTLRCSFLVGDEKESAWLVEFSKDGRHVAASPFDSSVRLWDTASCSETWTFEGEAGSNYFAKFRPPNDKLTLIQVLNGLSLKLVDAESGKEIVSILGHEKEGGAAEFTPDGTRLVTAGGDSLVKVWDLATGQEILSIAANIGEIESVAISRDGNTLAAGGSDGTIKLWKANALDR